MKTAVVLFNLGGPSSLQAVKPYLFNLFSDPAIMSLANPWRVLFAKVLSYLRAQKTEAIYAKLGGKSPLLENSQRQANALEKALGKNYKVFIAMRYWHPRVEEVVVKIKTYQPQHMVLLPLYPQYSTATTRSSLLEFETLRKKELAGIPSISIDCFPQAPGYIQGVVDHLRTTIRSIVHSYRVLFSAHGLPLKTIEKGDPYQSQVETTVAQVISSLKIPQLDYQICYQSRVGFLPWLKPYTIDEIKRAGQQKKVVVVVPISFVCENSETLFELDIQYKMLAQQVGVPAYYRVPTVSEHPFFIQALADLVKQAV